MKHWKSTAIAAMLSAAGATAAMAGCGIDSGKVSILSNDFPALNAVNTAAKSCAGDGVTVSVNQTTTHQQLQVPGLTADPAQYSVVIVANSSLVPLLNDNLVRPLNDLVDKYGQQLQKNQLITVDGKVMAVAFDANAQHLFYRADILKKLGISQPKTYDDVLAAAKKIRDAGIMKYPFAMNTKTGWNLGEEFVNMYMGYGGQLFKPGTAEPAIDNQAGIDALNMLKKLTAYSDPDFLTFNSQTTTALWQSGKLALAELWGTQASSILDVSKSSKDIVDATKLAGAPTVGGGDIPASTLWWDGFTIARNISDQDAAASFQAMMKGISPEMMKANADKAVWLIKGYQPTPSAIGVAATVNAGARPYPMVPYVGLMHIDPGQRAVGLPAGAEKRRADAEGCRVVLPRGGEGKGLPELGHGATTSGGGVRRAPSHAQGAAHAQSHLLLVHPAVAQRHDPVHRAAHRVGVRPVALRQAAAGGGHQPDLRPVRLHQGAASVDTSASAKQDAKNPLGVFNGFGTYLDRNHLAVRQVGDAWHKATGPRSFLGRLMDLPFYRALAFTLTYTFVVTPIVLVLGLAIALAVNAIPRLMRGPAIFASMLPMIVTPLVGSLILFWMIDAQGIIGATVARLVGGSVAVAQGVAAADMAGAHHLRHMAAAPFAFIVFYAGLQTVPEETLEAAMIDGASRWERVRYVVVPHLAPLAVFITLMQLMDNFRVFEPIVGLFRRGQRQFPVVEHLQRPAQRQSALRLGGGDIDADDPGRRDPADAGADPHLARLQQPEGLRWRPPRNIVRPRWWG